MRDALGPKDLHAVKPVYIEELYATMQGSGLARSVRFLHTIIKNALTQEQANRFLPVHESRIVRDHFKPLLERASLP